MELYRGNKLRVRSEHLDKVMAQLIRTWVYTHDHSAILSPKVEPMIKRLVSMVRRLLDEFCTTCTPDDLLVVVFYYADKFINQVGFMDKNHLTGVLISRCASPHSPYILSPHHYSSPRCYRLTITSTQHHHNNHNIDPLHPRHITYCITVLLSQ